MTEPRVRPYCWTVGLSWHHCVAWNTEGLINGWPWGLGGARIDTPPDDEWECADCWLGHRNERRVTYSDDGTPLRDGKTRCGACADAHVQRSYVACALDHDRHDRMAPGPRSIE